MKKELLRHYPKISICEHLCPSVLPAGYYSAEGSLKLIRGDKLQREPVLCFTSDFEMAAHIANKHPCVAGVLVCDHRKLGGNLSRVVKLQANNIRTVLFTDTSILAGDKLKNLQSLNFKVTAWTPSAVRTISPKPISATKRKSNPFEQAKHLVANMAQGKLQPLLVEDPMGEEIGSIWDKLHKLSIWLTRADDVTHFLNFCFGLIRRLTNMPFSLEQREHLKDSIHTKSLEKLTELTLSLSTFIPYELISHVNEIHDGIIQCVNNHKHHHPKYGTFCQALKNLRTGDCILVRTKREKNVLSAWLAQYNSFPDSPLRILTLKQALKLNKPMENCLSLGWYGREHARLKYTGLFSSEKIILYPFEKKWMNTNSQYTADYFRRFAPTSSKVGQSKIDIEFTPTGLEEVIDKIFARWEDSLSNQSSPSADDAAISEATIVEFEEDYMALLTSGYNCRCLNEKKEKIVVKKVAQLKPGDLLVFVKDSAEDIFDKLTELIKQSDKDIKDKADLVALWKRVFMDYMQIQEMSIAEFQKKLKQVGIERTTSTVRSWMDKGCICPEEDALRAIALIVQDAKLNSYLGKVIVACRQIRSLHGRLGKYLARMIVSATSGPLLVEESKLQELLGDLSSYADVMEVCKKGRKKVLVPTNMTNRLLDKYSGI